MVGGGTCTPLTYGIKLDGCSPRLYHERGNLLKMCLVTGKMRERERERERENGETNATMSRGERERRSIDLLLLPFLLFT